MSTPQLDKIYDPKAVEARWSQFWQQQGYFHASPSHAGQPYSIVIPPPNVTGSLHVGHALNHSLQDILIRWRRMQGRNVLSLPGTARFRLRPGDSGFTNLVLAGDWTRSGLNAGCIESATISGREAADALALAVARTEEHLHVDRQAARPVPAVAQADAALAARKAS